MRLLWNSPCKYLYRAIRLTPIRLANSFIVSPFIVARALTTRNFAFTATSPRMSLQRLYYRGGGNVKSADPKSRVR
jgi:hypothetical protein